MFDDSLVARLTGEGTVSSYAEGMGPVSAHAILAALRARAPGLGVKKAHKLLYYCQGQHLATFGRPLFAERISAWDMGPVVGQVWYAEKNGLVPSELPPLDEAALNTVGYVLSRYGGLSGSDLERLTHHEPPWESADDGRAPGTSVPIEQAVIEDFFRSAPAVDDDEAPPLPMISPRCARVSNGFGAPARVPGDDGWHLDHFEVELDAWADREGIDPDAAQASRARSVSIVSASAAGLSSR